MTIKTTGAQSSIDSIWARAETVLGAGRGEVQTSARRKERGERSRPLHGAAIWNIMRSRGHDPGDYDDAAMKGFDDIVVYRLERILGDCSRTHRPHVAEVRRLLQRAATYLAEWVVETITAGRLGTNRGRYAAIKKALTQAGILPSQWGTPAPYGVRTGRFVAGIKGGWALGGRQRHAQRLIVRGDG